MCQTASYYYFEKDPTFALSCAVPFGLNSRMQNAWNMHGGGIDLMNEFYARFSIYGLPAGNTGAQMGGWFRREIKGTDDMRGLKFRVGGYAGRVLQRLGVVPSQLIGGEIYTALERGTIDAAEWVGPYDDEKLGFHKVARFYYYPGWWEGGAQVHNFINLQKWNELPKVYRQIIQSAYEHVNAWMQGKYDAGNPAALRRLLAAGAELRAFPPEVIEACFKAANEVNEETSKANPSFKKLYRSMIAFRDAAYPWWQVAEYSYDTMMIRALRG